MGRGGGHGWLQLMALLLTVLISCSKAASSSKQLLGNRLSPRLGSEAGTNQLDYILSATNFQQRHVLAPDAPAHVYVVTVDGRLHAFDLATGERMWHYDTGPIIEGSDQTPDDESMAFVPDVLNGNLYTARRNSPLLQRLDTTVKDLATDHPRSFYTANGTVIFRGKAFSSMVQLEADTGRVLRNYDLEEALTTETSPTLDAIETHAIFVGRTRFQLLMNEARSNHLRLNMTYASLVPSSRIASPQLLAAYGIRQNECVLGDYFLRMGKASGWVAKFSSHVVDVMVADPAGDLYRVPAQREVSAHSATTSQDDHGGQMVQVKQLPNKGLVYVVPVDIIVGELERDLNVHQNDLAPYDQVVRHPVDCTVSGHSGSDMPWCRALGLTAESDATAILHYTVLLITRHLSKPAPRPLLASDFEPTSSSSLHSTTPPLPPSSSSVPRPDIQLEQQPRLIEVSDIILGRGSHGTIVSKGRFQSQDIAVKRVLKQYYDAAQLEVQILRNHDRHDNVIRYLCKEEDKDFLYIALELCVGTLVHFVEAHESMRSWKGMDRRNLDTDVLRGLEYLHGKNIIHRDLKPQNVLLREHGQVIRAVISDFGLGKVILDDRSVFTATAVGTTGWVAPEVLLKRVSSKAVDVFAAGCVVHYLHHNAHPFGKDGYEREGRIRHNQPQPRKSKDKLLDDLINKMIQHESAERPDVSEALRHPFFWDDSKRLAFLVEVSDRLEKVAKDDDVIQALETGQDLLQDLQRRRTYDGSSVVALMRAMRNKRHHYQEMAPELREYLGAIPSGFLQFFTSRFPFLICHVYNRVRASSLADETPFQEYL
ncbi:uncharacterized protein MONBRDRAFT_32345 [Monosiga brevicollis MX1]|uniref:non-specific serine/threonine protein kinase n=1 Tax=Monosiga brevicollis TaxID=81824 RepID=A9UYX8_MONBE|nr:uncharacterized protein MONBRDRAFT_32345 [Monosiga brevicollis MX1]EDQ89538.1 predicted protein [Monosiga brevicollis MX1]|eukprot:XP_001745567.1 hypothetical protein [Monosiga brevicollis MX1]